MSLMAKVTKLLVAISILSGLLIVIAQTNYTIDPTGVYAEIDTRLAIETIQILNGNSAEDKLFAMKAVLEKPELFAPPVFYVMSRELFNAGDKDAAAFWFYAGQLRARFDANRCADVTARSAVSQMNDMFGEPINEYAFQDLTKLEETILNVIAWDKATPHRYDHRWINLSGLGAVESGLEAQKQDLLEQAGLEGEEAPQQAVLSLPEEEWEAIEEQTRQDYLDGFYKATGWPRN